MRRRCIGATTLLNATSVDEYLERHRITGRIELVVIDTEGHDMRVLRGWWQQGSNRLVPAHPPRRVYTAPCLHCAVSTLRRCMWCALMWRVHGVCSVGHAGMRRMLERKQARQVEFEYSRYGYWNRGGAESTLAFALSWLDKLGYFCYWLGPQYDRSQDHIHHLGTPSRHATSAYHPGTRPHEPLRLSAP